jgi:hypothetical protein
MRLNRRAFLAGASAAGLAPTRRNRRVAANKQFYVFDSALHRFRQYEEHSHNRHRRLDPLH